MAEWVPTRRQFVSDLAAGIVVAILVTFALWGWKLANETDASRLPWNAFRSLTPWQIVTIILAGSIVTVILGSIQIVRRNSRPPEEQLPDTGALRQEAEHVQAYDARARAAAQQIGELQPWVDWAKELVERERGHPFMYLSYKALFWGLNLEDREPYFEVGIFLNYIGIFDLIIGERQSGRLSWQSKPFSHEPVLTMSNKTSKPFKLHGPTEGQLILRQYVTPQSGAEIQSFLNRGVEEIEFWAKDFEVSLSKVSFDGEVLSVGRLFGEYLEVRGTEKYKIPVEVRPSYDESAPDKEDSQSQSAP